MSDKTTLETQWILLEKLGYIKPFDGLKAKLVHTDHQTCAFWEIDEGAILPRHQHVHEQITIVTKGELELTIADETKVMREGMVAVIPSNTDHEARAITYVEVTDVFYPVREDLKS